MLSSYLGIGDTVSFVTRTIDNEVNFALVVNPEDDDNGGTAECLFALLGTCVAGEVRHITINGRRLNSEGIIVEGCAEVEFPHPMCQHSDAPAGSSDAFRCSGASDFLFAAHSPGRRRKPDDGPRYLSNHVVH